MATSATIVTALAACVVRPTSSWPQVGRSKSMPPTCEHLRVSTITVQGLLGEGPLSVNFSALFEHLPLATEPAHLAFQMIKYKDCFGSCVQRGIHPKRRSRVNGKSGGGKKGKAEVLRNHITIVQWLVDPTLARLHHVSIKVFTNGRVHIAGLRDPALGHVVISSIVHAIKECLAAESIASPVKSLFTTEAEIAARFSIIMINSDFKVPFFIKCSRLSEVARRHVGMRCHYEQDNNAGVKIVYHCVPLCGAPTKDITIIVCRTGSVIITGANSMAHVPIAHQFIRDFLFENRSEELNMVNTPVVV
eukprot:gene17290-23601_t